MKIASDLLAEVVAHATENPDIECCGVVAVASGDDGAPRTATRVYRAENIHHSALRFEIDPMELLRLNNEIDDQGCEAEEHDGEHGDENGDNAAVVVSARGHGSAKGARARRHWHQEVQSTPEGSGSPA